MRAQWFKIEDAIGLGKTSSGKAAYGLFGITSERNARRIGKETQARWPDIFAAYEVASQGVGREFQGWYVLLLPTRIIATPEGEMTYRRTVERARQRLQPEDMYSAA